MSEPRVLARHQFRQRLYSDACASCGGLLAAEAHWDSALAAESGNVGITTPPVAIPPEPTIPVDMVPLEGAGARYYQIVILRADQVDLIARRVIDFLHKDFEEDTAQEADPNYDKIVTDEFPDAAANRIRYDSTSQPVSSLPLLTIEDAAQRLRISRGKAYTMAKTGELPTVMIGTSIRVRPDHLDAYMRKAETK